MNCGRITSKLAYGSNKTSSVTVQASQRRSGARCGKVMSAVVGIREPVVVHLTGAHVIAWSNRVVIS